MSITVLVDFGDTLADETFMWHNSARFPAWTTHYGAVLDQVRLDWETGLVGGEQVARAVASRLDCEAVDVEQYVDELCRRIRFFPEINAALDQRRSRGLRQAIVTVNPDVFVRITELHQLAPRFDAIVASYEIGSGRKTDICAAACEQLGVPVPATVLVDNIAANVDAWIAVGGFGYLFTSDHQFALDVQAGAVPGFEAGDLMTTK